MTGQLEWNGKRNDVAGVLTLPINAVTESS
jgi:hypothetical protein